MASVTGQIPYDECGMERKFQLESLTPRHKEILRMASAGTRPSDMADELKVTRQMVAYTLHSSLGLEYLDQLIELRKQATLDVCEFIDQQQLRATEELAKSIDDPKVPYSEKYKNCRWLLEVGGNGPRRSSTPDGAYTREDIDRVIAKTLAEHREKLLRRIQEQEAA